MLINTFIHIDGIGAVKERRLWYEGIYDWPTFLELAESGHLPNWVRPNIASDVTHSLDNLVHNDHHYFKLRLHNRDQWRMFPEFRDRTVYLDIETTGLDRYYDLVTVVGLYDGERVKTLVLGRDIEKLPQILKKYSVIITFNGVLFDLPFLAAKFPVLEFDQVLLDLRFPLKRLGYRGGLKNIERQLGISRPSETEGLTGFDAVRLWREYERGDTGALELLIRYNNQDILNLEKLMEFTYDRLKEQMFAGIG